MYQRPDPEIALDDPDAYVRACFEQVPPEYRNLPEIRRRLTKYDSLLFALLYFRSSLRGPDTGNEITISRFHLDLFAAADRWTRQDIGPMEERDAWIAPRGSGKSTLMFLIIPLFLLAHGHKRYVIAFADTSSMAQGHLATAKRNIQQTNDLLKKDFPQFCKAARRPGGQSDADRQDMLLTASGAVFQAKGIDSTSLGAKVNDTRPDTVIFDDIEPPAENYSVAAAEDRLNLIRSAIFPMSLNAVVQFVGTTTMQQSIMDQIASSARDAEAVAPEWIAAEKIRAHYYPALLPQPDGSEESLWPARWTTEFLQDLRARSPRSFALNYLNEPLSVDSAYWSPESFQRGTVAGLTHHIISIDPAVTTKRNSDYTGISVLSFSMVERRILVRHTEQVKLPSNELRLHVLELLGRFPEVRMILVETNQGGDTWKSSVFHDMPVAIDEVRPSVKKELRWAAALDLWANRTVIHDATGKVAPFERQALSVPRAAHDDIVDSVVGGVDYIMTRIAPRATEGQRRKRSTTKTYARV